MMDRFEQEDPASGYTNEDLLEALGEAQTPPLSNPQQNNEDFDASLAVSSDAPSAESFREKPNMDALGMIAIEAEMKARRRNNEWRTYHLDDAGRELHARIFTQYQSQIARFLARSTSIDWDTVQDLAQDTLEKVGRTIASEPGLIPKLQETGTFKGWLFSIAKNTYRDYCRRKMDPGGNGERLPSLDRLLEAAGDRFIDLTAVSWTEQVADRDTIEQTLAQLPPKYLTPLILRKVYGYSIDEIAALLHKTPSATKMQLQRAKNHFINVYPGTAKE